jgi:beta-lactamase regulating signal transducer with metallopeptidase domain
MNSIQFAALAPAQFLVAGVWQGLLLTAVAWLGLKAFPKISPKNRFRFWLNVFVLAAVLPLFAAFRTAAPIPLSNAATRSIPIPHLPASWAVALVFLWVVASLVSLARLFWNGYSLWLLARTATPLAPEALDPELQSMLAKASPRATQILLSRRVDSPIVIGFFHRAIVIPEWVSQRLTQPELKQVFLHELAHLERRDDWTNLLQKAFRALFPLNPALLFADQQLCREREMACDDAVLDSAITPRSYAACLTALAEKRILQRTESLAPGAWRARSELAERVHRILVNHRQLGSLGAGSAVAVLLMALLPVGVVLARCPQIVSFRVVAFTAASDPSPNPPSEARISQPAEFVQASLRTVSPPQRQPIMRRPSKRIPKHRVSSAPALRIKKVELPQRMRAEDNFPVVFTLLEPATVPVTASDSDLQLSVHQISIFQSRTGWIVIQL